MRMSKKLVSIVLAVLLAALALVAPVAATNDVVPLIVVPGFFGTPLVQDAGTANEKELLKFSDNEISALAVNIATALVKGFIEYGTNNDDWNKLADSLLPVVADVLEPIAMNPDGTLKHDNVTNATFTKPMSEYAEADRYAIFSEFGILYGEEHGDENVYAFGYDWRKSPVDAAAELDAFIDFVKAETGAAKVNLVGISEGSCVCLSYMADYDTTKLNNVVFASPAWQGTSIVGSLFTGNIKMDIFAMENFLVQLGNGSAVTHFASVLISTIATYEGLSHEYFAKFDYALQQMLPRVYSDIVVPMIAGMAGIWAMNPAEYYDASKAYLYPAGMDAAYEAKIDAYHDIQANAQQVILDAEDDGVKFGIVCGYNCQIAPVNKNIPTSDKVVDTCYSSGGAICADYLKAFDDWGKTYEQHDRDGHNHVSWDMRVDASSCMFPEQTWFIKNLVHCSGYKADYGTCDIVMWLLNMDEQVTVWTDTEKYPQFNLYNTYKRVTTPCPTEGKLGDLDDNGAVSTEDVVICMEIVSGIRKANENQLFYGDIDEDGVITNKDARNILRIVAELPVQVDA